MIKKLPDPIPGEEMKGWMGHGEIELNRNKINELVKSVNDMEVHIANMVTCMKNLDHIVRCDVPKTEWGYLPIEMHVGLDDYSNPTLMQSQGRRYKLIEIFKETDGFHINPWCKKHGWEEDRTTPLDECICIPMYWWDNKFHRSPKND